MVTLCAEGALWWAAAQRESGLWTCSWKTPYLLDLLAAATIIFRSGKMRHLFDGGYLLRYAYTRIIVCILYSVSVVSQVNETFCFDSIYACSLCLQDSVDSLEDFILSGPASDYHCAKCPILGGTKLWDGSIALFLDKLAVGEGTLQPV